MPVHPAGFSERVFEFSFNAEFSQTNKAVLAAAPDIPTQTKEKWLGYDVEFQLKQRGGATHSIALQHKVARFVDGRGGSNAHFWDAVAGPYFAFVIDTNQFNLIVGIAGAELPGVDFYYCAPLFTTIQEMNTHYLHFTVSTNSVWIDVRGLNEIADLDRHTMVVSSQEAGAFLFSSEPRILKTVRPEEHHRPLDAKPVNLESLRQLYVAVYSNLHDYWPRRRKVGGKGNEPLYRLPKNLPRKVVIRSEAVAIKETGRLLSEYYGLTWLIEVAE